ncbi:MAG: DeoR/GlpR family DNA-binding transcription regulator [Devosia sp.]
MSDLDRHRQILEFLHERPFASVRDLQDHVGVSAATVRRDIDKLDETGRARKVYGGVSASESARFDFARPYDENRDLAVEAKRAIAELAASMVNDGDAVAVNAGSTCFHLGVRLANRNIRLFTNSMPLAAYVGENGTCALTLAGGELHREPRIIFPSDTSPRFYASKYFVGAQAVGAEGLLESHPMLVRAISQLSDCADQVIALVDSRKFSIHARYAVLPLARIGVLITDSGLPDAAAQMLENAGVSVRIADLEGGQ